MREPTSSLLVSALFELTIFPLINGAEHLFESVNGMDERQIILSSFSSLILFMEKNAHHLQKAFERKGQDLSQSIKCRKKKGIKQNIIPLVFYVNGQTKSSVTKTHRRVIFKLHSEAVQISTN